MNRLDRDEVRLHVPAEAGALYDLVADVTRTPEWSPEVVSCAWLDGAVSAAAGARFTARNRRRRLTWSGRQVVEVASRGSEFSVIRTQRGGGSIRWSYRFEPAGAGTDVVLAYRVLRPAPAGLHVVVRLLFGVRDLRAGLRATMVTSLGRLAELARRESAAGQPGAGSGCGPGHTKPWPVIRPPS